MENTKRIGNLTELQCAMKLYELNCAVSIPFGNSEKYDLIIDKDDKLYKIQVKHANPHYDELNEIDYIIVKCTWEGHNREGYTKHKYQANEIDYFATFFQGKCYLIPQNECSNQKQLRIKKPKNNQIKGINFLVNYDAEEVLKTL